jgi:hypothetical protein
MTHGIRNLDPIHGPVGQHPQATRPEAATAGVAAAQPNLARLAQRISERQAQQTLPDPPGDPPRAA